MDDTEGVVERSYIDKMFVRRVGIRHRRNLDVRPTIPPIWDLPKDLGFEYTIS